MKHAKGKPQLQITSGKGESWNGNERQGMNELALFAGAGGGLYGSHILGWRCICAVEYNAYARSVLLARQNDGTFPPFPVWDDVRTFDGKPWRRIVDVVSGGFPCQDISIGGNGTGIEGERSGLWSEMARIIGEVRPRFAWMENSPMLTSRGLGRVLADLAAMRFDARWGVLGASSVGAPHIRERIWILGFNTDQGDAGGNGLASRAGANFTERSPEKVEQERNGWKYELGAVDVAQRFSTYSDALRILHGMADRGDRLSALGNGQVPRVAATAWKLLGGP